MSRTDNDVLATARLTLRPWRVDEAPVLRALWEERDARVPPHRRIDSQGRPTEADLQARIAAPSSNPLGPLVILETATGRVLGWCGLVTSQHTPHGEPELAYELFRHSWGHGYATEAASRVIDAARALGYAALGATVWDWNLASRRVLEKLGFRETTATWVDPDRGTTILTMLALSPDAAGRVTYGRGFVGRHGRGSVVPLRGRWA